MTVLQWKLLAERAIKTVLQVAAATALADTTHLTGGSALSALEAGIFAGLLSVLTNLLLASHLLPTVPWVEPIDRALKSAVQALVTVVGAAGLTLMTAPWTHALAVAGYAAVASLLTSLASLRVGSTASPSLVRIPAVHPSP